MSTTNEPKKKMYILRGISGSGKSYLSRKILEEEGVTDNCNETHVFSSDDYFINKETGKYEYDGSKIGRAHEWNQNRVMKAVKNNQPVIIVDNTNTQRWEAKPYVQMALENGYDIIVREPDTPWRRDAVELSKRNVHGVPLESIQKMLKRWEDDFSLDAILKSKPPKHAMRKPRKQNVLCKYYAEGRCFKGDNCAFIHDQQAIKNSSSGQTS
jgi:predicted kinase